MPPAQHPPDESQRLQSLVDCGTLDTPAEPDFDDLTRLATEILGLPTAVVSLVDRDRQWFKSRVGVDAQQTPRSQAVCGYTILGSEPLVIPDLRLDSRTADNELVLGPPGLRFYAGVPLRLSDGTRPGALCVWDTQPRELTPLQVSYLEALARQASTQLELRRSVHLLEQSETRARLASEAKSAFLANMSHEIRTPLTAIIGYAELLDLVASTGGTAGQEELARTAIRRNADHLLTILNDLLDLSKIEAGQLSLEPLKTDLVDLTTGVIDVFSLAATQKGLDLAVEWQSPMPQSVMTDPTRLRQVLLNLVGNALKFTEAGRVRVRVACDPDAERARFVVADTGIGMTAGQIARLSSFAPFQQADESMSRRFGGTGLGLRISHLLANMLGGSLSIESEAGVGSRITVEIATGPLAGVPLRDLGLADDLASHRTAGSNRSAAGSRRAARPLDGVRVLLAEDGPDNQRLILAFLERAGATVFCVADGRTAVDEALGRDDYDLILMDVQMPVMDGHEATRLLRRSGFDRPILALTAHALATDRERCLEAGCSGYLTKPITSKRLVDACGAAVGRVGTEQAEAA